MTDKAANLRADLKKAGFSQRQVSVSNKGGSIRVKIYDPAVPSSKVEAIAKAYEDISRDGFGEILCGGNTYVSVGYSGECHADFIFAHRPAVLAAQAELAGCSENSLVPVGQTGFLVGKCHGTHEYMSVWKDGHISFGNDVNGVADTIGTRIAAGR